MSIPGESSAALDRLTAGFRSRGYQAHLIIPAGHRRLWLAVTNPQAPMLATRVMVDAESFRWPWAYRIAPVAGAGAAADVMTRVLVTGPGHGDQG